MNQNESKRGAPNRLFTMIGGAVGGTAGLTLGKLIGIEGFWPGLIFFLALLALGAFLGGVVSRR